MKICSVTEEECSHPERASCTYLRKKPNAPRLCKVWVQGNRAKHAFQLHQNEGEREQ